MAVSQPINSLYRLAVYSAWSRRGTLVWVVLCVALSTLLMWGIERLRLDAQQSFRQAVSGTDLIVGPRSGSIELLLYSVFRLGSAQQTIRLQSVRDVAQHPSVAWVVPLLLGDTHQGFAVLGTTSSYFQHFQYGDHQALRWTHGGPFQEGLPGLYKAVVGAEVAQRLGYQINDSITLQHGAGGPLSVEHADKPFEIIGILARTGTPVDRTVHVSLESITAIHLDWVGGAPLPGMRIPADQARKFNLTPSHVTAALVGLKNRSAVFNVQRWVANNTQEPMMALLPGVALDELWSLMKVGESALWGVSVLVAGVSLMGLIAVVLAGLNERRRELAVLRAIGASPRHVALLLVCEGMWMVLTGLAWGILLYWLLITGLGPWLEAHHGVTLQAWPPSTSQMVVLLGVFSAGTLASALPAWKAYRYALADGLSPST